jgi:hypothetical protein
MIEGGECRNPACQLDRRSDAQSVRRLSIDRAFDALVARIIRDGSSHLSLAKTMSPRHRRTPVHQHRIGAA